MKIVLFALAAAAVAPAQVRYEDIRKGAGANWVTYAGDYQGRSYSTLTQITPANAGSMAAKWVYHMPKANGLRSRPVVYEGVMYVTGSNEVRALDARSGRLIWAYKDTKAKKEGVNRGAALLGDRVFFTTADLHLVALDRRTGAVLFSKAYGDVDKGEFAAAAPLAIDGKIIVGNGGGDTGMRGSVVALSPDDGRELWRTYTVPARGEKGAETWGNLIEWGGGATWLSGTYDADTKTLFWTTGNPWPDFYAGDRQGDNLYTCSLLALDAETGKMKWYFQFTPGDTHDWDAQSWPVLVEIPWQGKPRKVVLHPNRNGFFYVLDRATGEYLNAFRMVEKLDWASGIDAKGRPIVIPGKEPTAAGNRVCPGVRGAANWMAPSWNPATGLLHVITLEQCDIFTSSSKTPEPKKNFSGGGAGPKPADVGQFFLRAFDPATGRKRWEYPMTGPAEAWSGTVSTATGLIFFGDDDGQLVALDARTGQHLWHFAMGESLTASPIIYAVDGKQHVAIVSATAVFAFALHEPMKPVPVPAIQVR